MDVHIDRSRIEVDKQIGNRELSLHQSGVISLSERAAQHRILDCATVNENRTLVARLAAYEPVRKKPRLGAGKDKVILRPGWDSPETDAEIEAMFDVLKESNDR